MERKSNIRKEILEKRKSLTMDEVAEMSEGVCRHIVQNQAFLFADTIYGYMPIHNEVDVMPVLRLALRMGKNVALPRTAEGDMDFYLVRDFSEVEPGNFSVLEPMEECPVTKDNGLMLVPLVAFDLDGNRIGYGKGFYDRYIEKSKNVYHSELSLFGIGFELQRVAEIPNDETDHPMDYIVTEKSVIKRG